MTTPYSNKALQEGSQLREWLLESVLGVGGFGIVYKGRGVYFKEAVAIKEYFPSSVSDRVDETTVAPSDSTAEEIYALGLQKFMEEAKVLWGLSQPDRHPNIVSVKSLFELNGTAYIVMDYEEGHSLSKLLKEGRKWSEQELLLLLKPIAEGLDRAHRLGVVHRDIKPANILLTPEGRPVLIDFGSARFDAGQATSTKVTFYTPPYAALEQYVKSFPQGPWTDIYALGVTLYECVTGKKLPDVLERMHDQPGPSLTELSPVGYSANFLRAVDAALALKPAERPQDLTQWMRMFDGDFSIPELDLPTQVATPQMIAQAEAAIARATPKFESKVAQGSESSEPNSVAQEAEALAPKSGRVPVAIWGGLAFAVVAASAGGVLLLSKPRPQPLPIANSPPKVLTIAPVVKPTFPERAVDAYVGILEQSGRPAAEKATLAAAFDKARGGDQTTAISALAKENAVLAKEFEAQGRTLAAVPEWQAKAKRSANSAFQKLRSMRAAGEAARDGAKDAVSGSDLAMAITKSADFVGAVQNASKAFAEAQGALLKSEAGRVARSAAEATSVAAEIETAAKGAKPWLFAGQVEKKAYVARQEAAAKAKSLRTEIDAEVGRATAEPNVLSVQTAEANRLAGLVQSLKALVVKPEKPPAQR